MTYLLDSDVCIQALGRRDPQLEAAVNRLDDLAISVITFGEVYEGVIYSGRPARDRQRWEEFLVGVDVIDATVEISEIWAELRGGLRLAGTRLADNDLIIAATALRFGLTLITRNVRHFARISSLALQRI